MKKSVLVIHGAGEPRRRDGKVYWERLLGPGLGPGYEVHAPRMPDPEDPHYQPWAGRIAELLEKHDQPVLVGHSLGASVLLKYEGRGHEFDQDEFPELIADIHKVAPPTSL